MNNNRCGYCWNNDNHENLRMVVIRQTDNKWSPPKLICPKCRDYLRGYFKYYKDTEGSK